jgi:hypothetical protein
VAGETYVQVAPDSSGQKIRNLTVTFVASDGTAHTVNMQVVSIADGSGRMMSFGPTEELLAGILKELQRIRHALTFEGIELK